MAIVFAIAFDGFEFIPRILSELPDCNTRDRIALLAERSDANLIDLGLEYGTSGYAADDVPMALIAAQRAKQQGFAKVLFDVVACGGDTDTIASMVGQIVGSKIGLSGIPEELRSLPLGEEVRKIAAAFADCICNKKDQGKDIFK